MTNPEQSRQAWNSFAAGYDRRVTPFSMRIGEDVADRLGVGTGTRFLDVAAGGGALSIPAARRGAQVLAIDYSPNMVERLEERAKGEGLPNLTARVMDGEALDLEDDAFDVAGSQFGIMLFRDRARGTRELARVTRPGGQGAIIAFGPLPRVEMFALFFGAVRSAVPGFTPPPESPLFSLQDPQRLTSEMTSAGFADVQVDTVTHTLDVESAEDLWGLLTSAAPPAGALAASLGEDGRKAAMEALGRALEERLGNGGGSLNVEVNVGIGTKAG